MIGKSLTGKRSKRKLTPTNSNRVNMVTAYKDRITEADFSTQVEGLLNLSGWRWHHSRPARTKDGWVTPISGDPGIPDIIAVRGDELIWIELKSERGRLTPGQYAWIGSLRVAGQRVYLWRPSDWDEVVEILGSET
jgi:hypothetical protein